MHLTKISVGIGIEIQCPQQPCQETSRTPAAGVTAVYCWPIHTAARYWSVDAAMDSQPK